MCAQMQHAVCEDGTVRRDMDLIRDVLLSIEKDARMDGSQWLLFSPEEMEITGHSLQEIGYNLNLLIEADFVKGQGEVEMLPVVSRLTWKGHEFPDNIRDRGVWETVKAQTARFSSVGLGVVAAIAEAEIKKRLGLP